MSARTVECHKYQMMEINGLRSSADLIQFAIKHGIATTDAVAACLDFPSCATS